MTELEKMGQLARQAARRLRTASPETKERALLAMANALIEHTDEILTANAADLAAAEGILPPSMIDRLSLNAERVAGMAEGIRAVAVWPDPVGKILETIKRPNGLFIEKAAVPLGVVGIILT